MASKVAALNIKNSSKNGSGGWGDGEDGSFPPFSQFFPVNKAVFGLSIFIATELMFFAGLISAFLILRANVTIWPPVDQPRLPVFVTGINTLFLLVSGYTIYRAVKVIRNDNSKALNSWLLATGILGVIFLGIQGYEWVRLVGYGLTMSSSIYGGTFYTLIGAHGLHVLIAVIVLIVVLAKAFLKHYSSERYTGVILCQIYWLFVVGIWPVLYVLVYLN